MDYTRGLFVKENGWLIIWIIILILGVFNTPATAPCSIEYFIYCEPVSGTIKVVFGGLIEILIQTFLFSIVSFYAIKHGKKEHSNFQFIELDKYELNKIAVRWLAKSFAQLFVFP